MKSIHAILCLGVLIGNLASAVLAKDAPRSAEELLSQVEAGIKAKDTNAVLDLVNWNEFSTNMKPMFAVAMANMATQEISSVQLLTLPPDYQATNELNGVRYFPNVQIQGLIKAQYKNINGATTIPYGKSGEAFYIAGVKQETFDANAKKAVSLGLRVSGTYSSENPIILNCSYTYLNSGKEKNGGFQCTNNWSSAFWGDNFKSCRVTKVSGSGPFQLIVTEGTKTVFDSGMVATNGAIVYEKKS